MADKFDELLQAAKQEAQRLRAESKAWETKLFALQETYRELSEELEDMPAKAAEYRKMKADVRDFVKKLDALGIGPPSGLQ